ncbi:TetR/AcrR family transcriptional regulator [Maricaulaceae bacterium MS644]
MMSDDLSTTPKRPRGRPPLGPEHRSRLIRAALTLLDKKGLDGLQARLIAAEAKLSVGSLYKLVGDIDDVAREAALETYRELYAHEVEVLKTVGDKPVREQLMALALGYYDFVERHERRWQAIIARRKAEGRLEELYGADENRLRSVITERLAQLPGPPGEAARNIAASALWASVHGIVTAAPHAGESADVIKPLIAFTVDAAVDRIIANPG